MPTFENWPEEVPFSRRIRESVARLVKQPLTYKIQLLADAKIITQEEADIAIAKIKSEEEAKQAVPQGSGSTDS